MYARIDPGVDPGRQKAFIVLWSLINLLACVGFLVLLGVGLSTARGRQNAVLLSFETIFALATAVYTMLTWTGHVGKAETPWTLCLVSGSFVSALAPGQASAACVLVAKAWAHALMVTRPRSLTLRWVSSSYVLAALPWTVSMSFFLATVVMGIRNPDTIRRTSPMYCTYTGTALDNSIIGVIALFELAALFLAAWTAALVLRTRWRVRSLQSASENAGSAIAQRYYPLIIRTLVFAVLLLVAFGANIGSAFRGFSNPIPDILTSFVSLGAVFVFGSDPNTIRTLKRKPHVLDLPQSTRSPVISLAFARPTDAETYIDVVTDAGNDSSSALELKNIHVNGGDNCRETLGTLRSKSRMSRRGGV